MMNLKKNVTGLFLCTISLTCFSVMMPSNTFAGDNEISAVAEAPMTDPASSISETAPPVSDPALPVSEPILIYGSFHRDGDRFMVTGVHGGTVADTVVLNTSDETRILNAVSGLPVSPDALKEGETVYAYVSQAMTLSLPPQSSASLILCEIPADYNVPVFETVDNLTRQGDSNFLLTTVRGNHYLIDSSTELTPYLTRNIVTVNDLVKDSTCLIWSEPKAGENAESQKALKIMIFPSPVLEQPSGPASDPMLSEGN